MVIVFGIGFHYRKNKREITLDEALWKVKYWTDVQEQLVVDFNNERDLNKRNVIYNRLRPALLKMYEIILRRYFKNFIHLANAELISDCESYLLEYSIPKFDPTKAKAYSLIGTSAKHYYSSLFLKIERHNVTTPLCLDDENSSGHDVIDPSITLHDQSDNYQFLKLKAKNRLSVLLQTKGLTEERKKIYETINDLIDQSNYTRYYSSYYLLARTKYSQKKLYRYLKEEGMEGLMFIYKRYDLEFYQRKIEEYKKKHKINDNNKHLHKDFVKEALNNLNVTEKKIERENKVQDAALKRTIKKKARQNNLKAVYSDLG